MTPMVDLAFLLLTFFMLTTSFNTPYIMRIEMPEKHGDATKPIAREQALFLVLGEKNKIYWYNGDEKPKVELTTFSSSGIRKLLLDKKAAVKSLYVIIKPTEKSKYRNIVDILDEMIIADIKTYSLDKITPAEKELIAESNL